MLGEEHSLLKDFPEHKEKILALVETDSDFAESNRQYNLLDEKIRELELNNSPIDDQSMHQLKHERSELKDSLYQQLQGA
jgi:uncharacterized protein YdcH (DUF465 family)